MITMSNCSGTTKKNPFEFVVEAYGLEVVIPVRGGWLLVLLPAKQALNPYAAPFGIVSGRGQRGQLGGRRTERF